MSVRFRSQSSHFLLSESIGNIFQSKISFIDSISEEAQVFGTICTIFMI